MRTPTKKTSFGEKSPTCGNLLTGTVVLRDLKIRAIINYHTVIPLIRLWLFWIDTSYSKIDIEKISIFVDQTFMNIDLALRDFKREQCPLTPISRPWRPKASWWYHKAVLRPHLYQSTAWQEKSGLIRLRPHLQSWVELHLNPLAPTNHYDSKQPFIPPCPTSIPLTANPPQFTINLDDIPSCIPHDPDLIDEFWAQLGSTAQPLYELLEPDTEHGETLEYDDILQLHTLPIPSGKNPRPNLQPRIPQDSNACAMGGSFLIAEELEQSIDFQETSPKSSRTRRTRIGPDQKRILDEAFSNNPYPESSTRERLAALFCITPKQVKSWFSNVRSRRPGPSEFLLVHVKLNMSISPSSL